MSAFADLSQMPLVQRLGWTLVHSLWQGAVAAFALALTLSIARTSRVRYTAACMAMIAILAGFAVTFPLVLPESTGTSTLLSPAVRHFPPRADGLSALTTPFRIADGLPWLTPFWIAGVILFYLRGTMGWVNARRLRLRGVCPAPDAWQGRLEELSARLRVSKPVALLETCIAATPIVIGFVRPVILIPVGMLTAMPTGQIEAILLHELAHIRRRDYLANLLQTAAEGVLFYHPAVWWISRVIRTERENCCDDLVVAADVNAHEYATALIVLEENRRTAGPAVVAATALSALGGGVLMKRIRRLLYPRESASAFLAPLFSVGILLAASALVLTAWQQPQSNTPPPGADPFTRWMNEDVAYIITAPERIAFQGLQTDDERKMFIEQFWLRRDPTPDTTLNEYQEEHYRRIAYANDTFGERGVPGWRTDRGRIYITFGPPDELDSHGPRAGKPAYDAWRYRFIQGIGNDVMMEFEDVSGNGEFKMTTDPNAK